MIVDWWLMRILAVPEASEGADALTEERVMEVAKCECAKQNQHQEEARAKGWRECTEKKRC